MKIWHKKNRFGTKKNIISMHENIGTENTLCEEYCRILFVKTTH